ncbi:glyoxylate utilization-related uncharacterized protein [Rhizobium soli]|uniref:Glyoxylate utilization-related uncharacterized protein n=1 Tax=Rhizobium soli TaxID=424798 RepID=A0A7X0MSI5_9HYPH|nr:glyoxylate utilization-related uncharacterized protein [Rhizobium soli]
MVASAANPDASGKTVFKAVYAVVLKTVVSDIVTGVLQHWEKIWAWITSRPLRGFAETFAQYIMELQDRGSELTEQLNCSQRST